jgi:hypothetical protein
MRLAFSTHDRRPAKALGHAHTTRPTNPSRAPCPSPPACGGRGRGPARREPQARGLDPRGREGEVGRAAVRNPGAPPPHPDPLRPQGRRGGYSGCQICACPSTKGGARVVVSTVAATGFPLSRRAVRGNFSRKSNRLSTLTPKSSCADLIRASTPLFRLLEGVDAHGSSPWAEGPRDKPGQDEVIRPISSLVRPQNFPGQSCAFAGMTTNR